jgi:RNase P/RNase MRP subunit p30
MFDIIRCEADPAEFGFDRFYVFDKAKVIKAENLSEAAKQRNRKSLIMLEDYNFDEGPVKLIAEKKKACFVIDIGSLLKRRGIPRAIEMSKLRTFLRLCNKHGAFYGFASFAENKNQIRSPEELMHIAMLLGINKGQAKFSLKMLQHYL